MTKRTTAVLALVAVCAACCTAWAEYTFSNSGTWPASWPTELEPLRKQAGTLQGGLVDTVTYSIPFAKRAEFEAAWPHLLKVKSPGAPIILVRSPLNHWHFGKVAAGVLVHCPPTRKGKEAGAVEPGAAIEGVANVRERWMWTTYVELVVDGEIVDLNRIPLPPDTPIVDERFKDAVKK